VIMLIAGGFFTVWLAYLNAAKGVGGSMLIMLFKMITGVEQQLGETFKMLSKISNGKWIMVLVALAILILVIMSVIMERSEYRIPVTRVMINNDLNKDSYRSEEHTSELQSRFDIVCRLLLEKKNLIIK